jgi:hypothetical protein
MPRIKYRNFPFVVKFPRRMPRQDLNAWLPTLKILARAARENDIEVRKVVLHHHTRSVYLGADHPMGAADTDEMLIELCAEDVDTALHEIAHVWTRAGHSPTWAEKWMFLQDKYIEDKSLARKYYEVAVADYRGVRQFLGISEKSQKPKRRILFRT